MSAAEAKLSVDVRKVGGSIWQMLVAVAAPWSAHREAFLVVLVELDPNADLADRGFEQLRLTFPSHAAFLPSWAETTALSNSLILARHSRSIDAPLRATRTSWGAAARLSSAASPRSSICSLISASSSPRRSRRTLSVA